METRYSRAQKEEALETFRKQIANGSVMSGEIQELSRRLNIPTTTPVVPTVPVTTLPAGTQTVTLPASR